MMLKVLFVLFLAVSISGQTWVSRARIKGNVEYFNNVMQETVYELERREWCNLKLVDITKTVNQTIYNWHLNGTVLYTNGFVISIQKLDVSNFLASVATSTVNGTVVPDATIRGRLNMRNVRIGYDVFLDLTDSETQRYTGDILTTLIVWEFQIRKDLISKEISVSQTLSSLSGGLIRMTYRPANNITEVLSRNFLPGDNWDGVQAWGANVFNPIILDIVTNKIDFPEICFSNNC